MEIERKFLIEIPEKINEYPWADITQTYLPPSEAGERRIRRVIDSEGNINYYFTIKSNKKDLFRMEDERKVSAYEYNYILENLCDLKAPRISKKRYKISYENQLFEIDIFPFSDKFALMEIELTSSNQVVNFPPEITIIKEVTGDEQFYNSELALNPLFFKLMKP